MLNQDGDLTDIPSELRPLARAIGKLPPDESVLAPGNMGIVPRAANDNYPRLVAFTGPAGSGKSTATKYLVERRGYELIKFAGPLKDMCRAIGMTEAQIEGAEKEKPRDELCGKSPRQFMQLLGTQFGRECIGDDFWVNMWLRRVLASQRVVVDDCRFPNEAAAIRMLGGVIIRLEGRGGIQGSHESEAGCGTCDAVISNTGCITSLYADVEEEVRRRRAA